MISGLVKKFRRHNTAGSLVERFKNIYGLTDGMRLYALRHDAVHAMTGLGITVADEERIAVMEVALTSGSEKDAFRRDLELYRAMTDPHARLNASPSGLATEHSKALGYQAARIKPEEVKAQYALGIRMHQALVALTGKSYREIPLDKLARLDFRKVNFAAAAHAIKNKYERPKNREIESETAKIFRAAAAKQGKNSEDIPDAGQPWHNFGLQGIRA